MNQINSGLSDPAILMMRIENRPLLDKIIQEHARQQDDKSVKLEERANKLIRIIDRVRDVHSELTYVFGDMIDGIESTNLRNEYPIRIEEGK